MGFAKNDPIFLADAEERPNRFVGNKTLKRVSALRFTWLKDSFIDLMNSPKVMKRAKIVYYVVPVTCVFGGALKHYLTTKFIVYLKYQAMVDEYNTRMQV